MKEIELIISSLIVIAGWIFNGWWSSKRAVQDDKRKIITSHLIDAYRILNNEVAHRKSTEERNKKLESLIGAIQLFGNEEQIELAKKLAYDTAKGGIFELDPLINSLRDSLRKSLNLKHIQGNVTWVRFNDNDVNKRNQD